MVAILFYTCSSVLFVYWFTVENYIFTSWVPLLLCTHHILFAAILSRVKVHYWLQAPTTGKQEYGVEMVSE